MFRSGKSILLRLIAVVLCLSMLTGCTVIDRISQYIADQVIGLYDPLAAYDLSLNDPAPTQDPDRPNGVILYETVLMEDILRESVLHEETLEAQILQEIVLSESPLFEDVVVESVLVTVAGDMDDIDDFLCEAYYAELLDMDLIRQRLSDGIALVLAEVVIDTGSAVLNIVTCNWGGLIVDAGQIALTAGGTTLMAFIEGQIARAKSLAAGSTYEVAMYDAIRAATDAYYYTAVALDVANTILSTAQLLEGLYDTGRIILGKLQQAESIRDAAGNVIGALKNGDQIELRTGGRKRTCRLAADGTLYDLRGNYVGVLDDDLQFSVRSLPEAIHANNRLRFTIEDGRLYRITQTTDGAAIRTCKGTVDGGGIVRNLHGQIVEKIDLNTGQTLESYRALTESLQKAGARNVTVNTFGELVYADSGKALRKKRIHGVTTYVDDAGNPLLTEYMGTGDTVYLKSAGTGRTVGALADGVFDGAWENTLNLQRSRATQAARDAIARFVQDKPNRTVRKYFP
ncbi:MAG: hypothetical protein IJY28_04465, partial [Clostridia bacterium]|nr:hypothetical protein [Clostridia bacterium]